MRRGPPRHFQWYDPRQPSPPKLLRPDNNPQPALSYQVSTKQPQVRNTTIITSNHIIIIIIIIVINLYICRTIYT